MATENTEALDERNEELLEEEVQAPSEELFSKRRQNIVSDPLSDNNPITVQVLGICSALAVTTKMWPTFIMAISVIFVMVSSNLIISLIRNYIPNRVRIIVMLAVIASLVALVDQILRAFLYDVAMQLSVFIGLIITNCIIMGRLEAFATGNKPWDSVLDGFGSALGYAWIILAVAFFRELFGTGEVFGLTIIPDFVYSMGYEDNGLMVFPIGAFIILGLLIWVQRTKTGYVES